MEFFRISDTGGVWGYWWWNRFNIILKKFDQYPFCIKMKQQDYWNHFLGQMGKFSADETALKKLIFTSQSKKNQQKEVRSHYDIGNDFYKLWLDDTMSYSCGYFQNENGTPGQAQINKVDYILKKLYLKKGMHLLDIGWFTVKAVEQMVYLSQDCGYNKDMFCGKKEDAHEHRIRTCISVGKCMHKSCSEKQGLEDTYKVLWQNNWKREGR